MDGMSAPRAIRENKVIKKWPVYILAIPAFVAIWGGWVSIGMMTGFGVIHPLPGIIDRLTINTAITLPIGVEAYAAYAMYVWLSGMVDARTLKFARISTVGALVLGMVGQAASHVMTAAGWTSAPWPVTALVACLPVTVFGLAGALAHMTVRAPQSVPTPVPVPVHQTAPDHAPERHVASPVAMITKSPRGSELAAGIMDAVTSAEAPVTLADLARTVGRSRSTVAYQLDKLINGGRLIMTDGRIAVAD